MLTAPSTLYYSGFNSIKTIKMSDCDYSDVSSEHSNDNFRTKLLKQARTPKSFLLRTRGYTGQVLIDELTEGAKRYNGFAGWVAKFTPGVGAILKDKECCFWMEEPEDRADALITWDAFKAADKNATEGERTA